MLCNNDLKDRWNAARKCENPTIFLLYSDNETRDVKTPQHMYVYRGGEWRHYDQKSTYVQRRFSCKNLTLM